MWLEKLELKLPPVAVALICVGAMWLAARLPWGAGLLPAAIRLEITALMLLLGAAVGFGGIAAFRRHQTTVDPTQPHKATALVTSGVYRLTRNPMYLGLLLFLAAWGCYLSHLGALLLLIPFVLYMNRFQILPEERVMAYRFGAQYELYSRNVRRWL